MKLEIYKCAILTVIAGVMVFFAWKVQSQQIFVELSGGSLDVSVDGPVEIQGKDDGPVEVTSDDMEVTGSVAIEH